MADEGEAKKAGGSLMTTVLGFVLASLIAGGAGAGYAWKFAVPEAPKQEEHAEPAADAHGAAKPKDEKKDKAKEALRSGPYDLKAVVASLSFPADVWVRVDATIQLDPLPPPEADLLAEQLTNDMEIFLHTLSLPQLQGAAGLQNLREDLHDRMVIRSKGKVRDLFIRGFVLQ